MTAQPKYNTDALLLPASDITVAVDELTQAVNVSSLFASKLVSLITYVVRRQWITKQAIGPERLSVRDNVYRTNNILESYQASLRRRILVTLFILIYPAFAKSY